MGTSTSARDRALERARARLDEALASRPDDANLLLLRGRADVKFGRHAEATEWFRRAAALCRKQGDRPAEAAALMELSEAQVEAGDVAGAVESLQRCVGSYELLGELEGAIRARTQLAQLLLPYDPRAAHEHLDRLIALLRKVGDPGRLCDAHGQMSELLEQGGDLDGALDQAKQAAELAARTGDEQRYPLRMLRVGQLYLRAGRWAKCAHYVKKALPYLESRPLERLRALSMIVEARAQLGEHEQAGVIADEAARRAEALGEHALSARIRWLLGRVLIEAGEAQRGMLVLDASLRRLEELEEHAEAARGWLVRADLHDDRGETLWARRARERAEALWQQTGRPAEELGAPSDQSRR